MKQLTLKNYHLMTNPELGLLSIVDWLSFQKLHGKESRSRSRFIKLCADRLTEIDKERIEMLKEFAEKDKKGDPIMLFEQEKLDKDGKPVFDPATNRREREIVETTDPAKGKRYKLENAEGFNKAFQEYMDEPFVIDVTPSNRETIEYTKKLVLETNEEFSGHTARLYDEWCDAFENVKDESTEKKAEAPSKDKKSK